MTTTFTDLMDEVQHERAWLLMDKPVGPQQVRRILVQREDGSIWAAEDWYTEVGAMAVPWPLNVLVRVHEDYVGGGNMLRTSALDVAALGDYIANRRAQDEVAAAVEAAEYLVRGARK